jgi:hypothetical protein
MAVDHEIDKLSNPNLKKEEIPAADKNTTRTSSSSRPAGGFTNSTMTNRRAVATRWRAEEWHELDLEWKNYRPTRRASR